MHWSVLAAFTVALAIALALPGPGIFAVVTCAVGRGLRAALTMGVVVILTVGLIPAAAASRRFFRSPARLRLLNRTAGTMLIGSGVTGAAG